MFSRWKYQTANTNDFLFISMKKIYTLGTRMKAHIIKRYGIEQHIFQLILLLNTCSDYKMYNINFSILRHLPQNFPFCIPQTLPPEQIK